MGIRRITRKVATFLFVVVGALGGCAETATTVWSPDGKFAAYATQGKGHLIDADGKVVAPLGQSLGAAAWSADSATLYHARTKVTKDLKPPYPVEAGWLPQPDSARPATTNPVGDRTIVAAMKDGKGQDLFDVAGDVMLLRVSDDGAFLAATVTRDGADDTFHLYVYSTATKKLYLLDDLAGLPIEFGDDGKLLYVATDRNGDGRAGGTAKLVEVQLAPEVAAAPTRTPLVSVLASRTVWFQRTDGAILFTSTRATFPSPQAETDDDRFDLFAFTPADKKLVAIAEEVGPLFAVSPDGKRVLAERKAKEGVAGGLVVMNANGSDPQLLRPDTSPLPAFPAWRGNDEISYTSPKEVASGADDQGNARLYYDLVLYRLADGKFLEPIKTLSTDWPNDMRPYASGPAATQP